MPNYLTKEEIRQWRSSLEKITLEEFAARLGKTVEESKATNDVVDIVMSKGTSSNSSNNVSDSFSAIAERAFKRERQISHTPFSISQNDMYTEIKPAEVSSGNKAEIKDLVKKALNMTSTDNKSNDSVLDKVEEYSANTDINIVLKKTLTDREQLVFEYFLNNIGKPVFAKDLADASEQIEARRASYETVKMERIKEEEKT